MVQWSTAKTACFLDPFLIAAWNKDAKRRINMAYKITDECISCGTCVEECPVNAISEGDDKYVIDANLCTDCGACAEVCPTEAIEPGN
jgi:ferredoxin